MMPLTESQIADLVTAMLTVNQYPLDKAVALMPGFKKHDLLSPEAVAEKDQETVMQQMRDSGYTRGGFLPIVSYRLFQLMEAIRNRELDKLAEHVQTGNEDAFVNALTRIHGFGPTVSSRAWMLCSSSSESS